MMLEKAREKGMRAKQFKVDERGRVGGLGGD